VKLESILEPDRVAEKIRGLVGEARRRHNIILRVASLPRNGWELAGEWRPGEPRIALAEGPAFEDYESGSGRQDYQAL
jgi:hypothetical protein